MTLRDFRVRSVLEFFLTRSANSLHSVLTRICLVLFELNSKFKMLEYLEVESLGWETALWPGSWYSISFNEKFTSAARIWFLFWPSRAHRKLNGGKAYTHRFAMNFFAIPFEQLQHRNADPGKTEIRVPLRQGGQKGLENIRTPATRSLSCWAYGNRVPSARLRYQAQFA